MRYKKNISSLWELKKGISPANNRAHWSSPRLAAAKCLTRLLHKLYYLHSRCSITHTTQRPSKSPTHLYTTKCLTRLLRKPFTLLFAHQPKASFAPFLNFWIKKWKWANFWTGHRILKVKKRKMIRISPGIHFWGLNCTFINDYCLKFNSTSWWPELAHCAPLSHFPNSQNSRFFLRNEQNQMNIRW